MQNRLQEERERRGLSRMEFAKQVGVEYFTVWRWETSKMGISQKSLMKCAQVLEVAMSTIVPDLHTIFKKEAATKEVRGA
jgi:transcriptional regulator with XRE-family HTH domain